MANYSSADVKKLRELTGAGFMDCKKALEENEGDFDKAIEFLRIKSAKNASKRAERTTAEGLVASHGGALIELDCETDFVAKNAEFLELGATVAAAAATADGTVEGTLAASAGAGTVAEAIDGLAGRIGEKLVLNRVVKFDGQTTVYLHKRSADLPPAIGVLVQYTGDNAEAARGAAMQVSAPLSSTTPSTARAAARTAASLSGPTGPNTRANSPSCGVSTAQPRSASIPPALNASASATTARRAASSKGRAARAASGPRPGPHTHTARRGSCSKAGSDEAKVAQSIQDMVDEVQTYVPGYRLRGEPQFDRLEDGTGRVATFIEVEGAGDYLPPYSGNLDIMTAAATKVGDEMARELLAAETEIEDGS